MWRNNTIPPAWTSTHTLLSYFVVCVCISRCDGGIRPSLYWQCTCDIILLTFRAIIRRWEAGQNMLWSFNWALMMKSWNLSTKVDFCRVRLHFSVRWRHPTIFILTMHMWYHTIDIQSDYQTVGSWAKYVVIVQLSIDDEKLKPKHESWLLSCAFAFLGAMEASDHLYIDNAHVISYYWHSERLSDVGKLGKISCDRLIAIRTVVEHLWGRSINIPSFVMKMEPPEESALLLTSRRKARSTRLFDAFVAVTTVVDDQIVETFNEIQPKLSRDFHVVTKHFKREELRRQFKRFKKGSGLNSGVYLCDSVSIQIIRGQSWFFLLQVLVQSATFNKHSIASSSSSQSTPSTTGTTSGYLQESGNNIDVAYYLSQSQAVCPQAPSVMEFLRQCVLPTLRKFALQHESQRRHGSRKMAIPAAPSEIWASRYEQGNAKSAIPAHYDDAAIALTQVICLEQHEEEQACLEVFQQGEWRAIQYVSGAMGQMSANVLHRVKPPTKGDRVILGFLWWWFLIVLLICNWSFFRFFLEITPHNKAAEPKWTG